MAVVEESTDLERVADALRERGFDAHVATDGAAARSFVANLIPSGAAVLTAPSETLRAAGLAAEIDESGHFHALRPELMRLAAASETDARRRLAGVPDVIVGSVQAVTVDGRIVLASATGSQLAPAAFGAGRVIWVVGAQKIVADLDAAFRRIRDHCLPLESERVRQAYGRGSVIAKTLIVDREINEGRITVVLVNATLGY